jgi:hypothetical protein
MWVLKLLGLAVVFLLAGYLIVPGWLGHKPGRRP